MSTAKSTPHTTRVKHAVTALHNPPTDAVVVALRDGLEKQFASVKVDVVRCPNLQATHPVETEDECKDSSAVADSSPPTSSHEWGLACTGLGATGEAVVLDLGSVSNLLDPAKHSRDFDLPSILRTAGLSRQGFVVGAGAGAPQHTGGTVGEAMPNLLIDEEGRATRNLSAYSTWNEDHVWQGKYTATKFGMLQNLLATSGATAEVLHIRVRSRKGDTNFTDAIKASLETAFPGMNMAMGGVFRLSGAPMHMHIMNSVPACASSVEALISKLRRFEVPAEKLTCLTTIVTGSGTESLRPSNNPHTHCFGPGGNVEEGVVGGHYHFDTHGEDAAYEGFFVVAHKFIGVSVVEDGECSS